MKYSILGKTGLRVSRLCLGSNNFGRQLDERNSIRVINKAIDLGINVVDTADVYTQGKSEEIIGKAVAECRERILVATKVGNEIVGRPGAKGLSKKHINWAVEESLRRLQSDYIDIYYLHLPDPQTPLRETLETLDDLVNEGKVRYTGCSNFDLTLLKEAESIQAENGLVEFTAVQPRYNLIQREVENDLLPHCLERSISVFSYSPYMGGFLTGKYQRGKPPPEGSRGAMNPRFFERIKSDTYYDVVEELSKIATEKGVPSSALALAWILRNPAITAPIVGASSAEQVEANCAALELELDEEIKNRLDSLVMKQYPS